MSELMTGTVDEFVRHYVAIEFDALCGALRSSAQADIEKVVELDMVARSNRPHFEIARLRERAAVKADLIDSITSRRRQIISRFYEFGNVVSRAYDEMIEAERERDS